MMKKSIFILIMFSLGCILSSCPGDISVTYETIKSVNVSLILANELRISIVPDSIYESKEIAQSYSLISGAYAMENPNQIIYTNAIDSINIFTIYDFNEEYPAGSNVNDILRSFDVRGDIIDKNINDLSSEYHIFKFTTKPQFDSLRFEVFGRITNEQNFNLTTNLIVLE
jgi:hypothetical protein